MKVKGIALSVVVFATTATIALACVIWLSLSSPVSDSKAGHDFAVAKKADEENQTKKLLDSIEKQRKDAEKALKNQIDNNLKMSLQSLTNRIKGDLEGYVNISQQLALTSATEKLNLDRKQRQSESEAILPIRFSWQHVQYLPAANRQGYLTKAQQGAQQSIRVAQREVSTIVPTKVVPIIKPVAAPPLTVTPSDLPDYRLALAAPVQEGRFIIDMNEEWVSIKIKEKDIEDMLKEIAEKETAAETDEPRTSESVEETAAETNEPQTSESGETETAAEEGYVVISMPVEPEQVEIIVESVKEEPTVELVPVPQIEEPLVEQILEPQPATETAEEMIDLEAVDVSPPVQETAEEEVASEKPEVETTVAKETVEVAVEEIKEEAEEPMEEEPEISVEPTAEEIESRDFLKDLSYKIVQQNNDIASAWLCWEPKAFNVHTTDRFSVHTKRGAGGSIATEEFAKPDTATEYIEAIKSRQTVISNPMRQNGGYVVSISTPITYRSKSSGVCGVNVNTDTLSSALQLVISANPLFRDGGKAYLISPEGKIVASSDPQASIGGQKVWIDDKKETAVESPFTLLGKNWQIQLVVPKSAIEEPINALQKGYETQLELIQANSTAWGKSFDDLQQKLQIEGEARQKKDAGKITMGGFAALLLIVAVAYFWQRSLNQRSEWYGNVQQQILDSLVSPVLLTDTNAVAQMTNKSAESKKISVVDAYIKSLGQKQKAVDSREIGSTHYEIQTSRLTDAHQKQVGAVQVFTDVTAQTTTQQQLQKVNQITASALHETNGIISASRNLQLGIDQSARHIDEVSEKVNKTSELTEANGRNASERRRLKQRAR